MMKFWKRICAAAAAGMLCMSGVPLTGVQTDLPNVSLIAGAETYGNLTYAFLDNGTIEITDCDSSVTEIEIPSEINGVLVTSIGESAFSLCENLISVSIPDSVTSIGVWAFYKCTSLTGITIPNSVTSIGDYAFYRCTSLSSVTIPDSVTSIGSFAFYECTSLISITIPAGVTSIGKDAFMVCSGLTDIIVSDENASYSSEEGVLFDKEKKVLIRYPAGRVDKTYTIPDGVTSIGYDAFFGCTSLAYINIPAGLESIEAGAFSECTSLTKVTIPDGVTSIEDHAFYNCSSLTNITIPDSVTSIRNYAFYGCSSLTSIAIPNGLTSIWSYAFNSCVNLTDIAIPDSVKSIGEYAFQYCNSLNDVYYSGTGEAWNAIAVDNTDDGNAPLLSAVIHYMHYIYGDLSYIILENGTIEITGCNEAVTAVEIPEEIDGITVSSIGEGAFSNCTGLSKIAIPNSITTIKSDAFSGCNALTDIYFQGMEAEWTAIEIANENGGNAPLLSAVVHYTYGDLSYIISEDGTITITDCDESVKEIVIPVEIGGAFVSGIGANAFDGCQALTDVYFMGDEAEWAAIEIDNASGGNAPLVSAVLHFVTLGNLDGDDKVTMSDAYTALLASSMFALGADSGLTDAQITAADVDGDGKLTMTDAYWILLYSSYVYVGEEITWEELMG